MKKFLLLTILLGSSFALTALQINGPADSARFINERIASDSNPSRFSNFRVEISNNVGRVSGSGTRGSASDLLAITLEAPHTAQVEDHTTTGYGTPASQWQR